MFPIEVLVASATFTFILNYNIYNIFHTSDIFDTITRENNNQNTISLLTLLCLYV